MKVYGDNSKTELVAEIPWNRNLSLLDWEHAEYDGGNAFLSIPVRTEGNDGLFNILVAASAEFGTDFESICCDQIELCIYIDRMESLLYINNGEDDGFWGTVELNKDEFLMIMDGTYKRWREKVEHEYIVP